MLDYNTESRLQVRSNCVIAYSKYTGKRSQKLIAFRRQNMSLQRTKAYGGTVTTGMQKRITKAVNLLIMTAKDRVIWNEVTGREQRHKMSFITLTVSENDRNLEAREAYDKLLRPFLQWATKYKGLKTYIWKAELQKRGQIHYHITTHTFLNWREIREKWNNLQRQNGLLDSFRAKYGHDNPNSTDVHEVYKKSDLTSYLIKYIAKADSKKNSTTGKLWDCSQNLKSSNYPDYEVNNEQSTYMDWVKSEGYLQSDYRHYIGIHKLPGLPGSEVLCETLQAAYTAHIDAIRSMPVAARPAQKTVPAHS